MWQHKGVSVDAGARNKTVSTQATGGIEDNIGAYQGFVREMRAQITELCAIQDQVNALRQLRGESSMSRMSPSLGPPRPGDTHTRGEPVHPREQQRAGMDLGELAPLFRAAEVSDTHCENISNIFNVAAAGGAALDLEAFTEVMVWLQVPREHCRQYFRAFDLDAAGEVDFRKFLLGVVAMDNATWHGGIWAEMRARYIFRTYDVNGDGRLDVAEMIHLIRHLRRGRGDATAPQDVESEAICVMDAICEGNDDTLSFSGFLKALPPFGDTLHGSSALFRLGTPVSPKTIDFAALTAAAAASAPAADQLDEHGSTECHPASDGSDLGSDHQTLGIGRRALGLCRQMGSEKRAKFLSDFFAEFCAEEDQALDLENYDWIEDSEPHPGVRGMDTDPGDTTGLRATQFAPNESEGNHMSGPNTEHIDIVLSEFRELMEDDPGSIDFLRVLVSELSCVMSHNQQSQVIAAVRNSLSPDTPGHGVSTGMGIAAELLGTQQGDRLPSRRGKRTKLGATSESDQRPVPRRPDSASCGAGAPSGRPSMSAAREPDFADNITVDDHSRHGPLANSAMRRAISAAAATPESAYPASYRQVTETTVISGSSSRVDSSLLGAYDFAEPAESASSVPSDEEEQRRQDESALTSEEYTTTRYVDASTSDCSAERSSSRSSCDSDGDDEVQLSHLAQEYSNDIKCNEAIGYELNNTLTKLIEAGLSLNEHEDRTGSGVILSKQQLEMVAHRLVAIATEDQSRQFDAGMRETLVAVHVKYAGMNASNYKDTLVQEISDLLYDEMIFTKVLQQVEQSYDEDIKEIYLRLDSGANDTDLRDVLRQLLAQRHSDVNQLHREREKRLCKKCPGPGTAADDSPQQLTHTFENSLSAIEPDSSDSASDNSEEAPIEMFSDAPTTSDVNGDASHTRSIRQADDVVNKNDSSVADLPEAKLDAKPTYADGVDSVDTLTDSLLDSSPHGAHALDGVVKLNETRLQELKVMMNAEQMPHFPGDSGVPVGADDLDIEPEIPSVNTRGAMNRAPAQAASQTAVSPSAVKASEPQQVTAEVSANQSPSKQKSPPWTVEQVKEGISKKTVVTWLQEHASDSILDQFKLRGQVSSVAKKKKKGHVVEAYAKYLSEAV